MKRKLTEADGRHVVAARLRKDLSAIFELPCVPRDVPPAPQPAAFVGALYAYQRRSLARMLEIERGAPFTVQVSPSIARTYAPKGGVVADTVGMGKTAQLIALMLARPRGGDDADAIGALVLTPEHLCHQWRAELEKFARGALNVAVATNDIEAASIKGAWAARAAAAAAARGAKPAPQRVLVASLEHACEAGAAFFARLGAAGAARAGRLVLDECHDAVLLDGGRAMETLAQLRDRAERVWCVTGTPFPEGDRSVFGLHQLLGVPVRFVLSNSPFAARAGGGGGGLSLIHI